MASKAGQPAKPKAYPAPSREAWKDLRCQLQSLRKAGKGANLNAQWDKAKSQSDKRTFYYEVFLLDPQVSQKEVHKESLQKHTSLQKAVSGWMTMWEIGKLEGADPSLPSFESLCKAAVDGLPSRSHEVAAWAKQGIKQYWYCKELHKETATKHTSSTKTSEKVAELEDEPFRKVEEALRVSNEGPQTLMLGNKAGRPGSSKDWQQQVQEDEASEEKQPEEGELYKKAVQAFRKAVNAYSSASNKVTTMLASLDKASPEVQADPQRAVSKAQLQELQSASSKERNQWNTALAKWPATWAVAAGFENEAEKVEEVKLEKSKCEQSLKELNKVLAPTKVWAKGKGLEV